MCIHKANPSKHFDTANDKYDGNVSFKFWLPVS